MFQVHEMAAVKRQRRAPKRTAPVSVISVPEAVMAAARALTECPCRLRPQADGSVVIVNRTTHCP